MSDNRKTYTLASLLTVTLAAGMIVAGFQRFRWYDLTLNSYIGGVLMLVVGCTVGRIMGIEPAPRWSMLVVSLAFFMCIVNGMIPDQGDGVVLWSLSCAAGGIVVGTSIPSAKTSSGHDPVLQDDSVNGPR